MVVNDRRVEGRGGGYSGRNQPILKYLLCILYYSNSILMSIQCQEKVFLSSIFISCLWLYPDASRLDLTSVLN